mmetsp:Transcript_1636/g.2887  ORF Transcript_1636/g.2887 Transcript_1636/m.2887 type:complete len:138 (+) Transcript_1636:51-464(+)
MMHFIMPIGCASYGGMIVRRIRVTPVGISWPATLTVKNELYQRKAEDSSVRFESQSVSITFLPSGKKAVAQVGENLLEVALRSGVSIGHDCKEGSCFLCEVEIDGSVVRSCLEPVPAKPNLEVKVIDDDDTWAEMTI